MRFDDALHEVLQGRRYNRLTGRSRNWREVISDFFDEWLASLLERLNLSWPTGGEETRVVPLIFAVIGGILLTVGIIVLVRMFLRGRRPKVHDLSSIFEELAQNNYTVAELLELCQNTDDRRTAVRYRYIAALLALNEREMIQILPSATNAIILRGLKKDFPTLAIPFTEMANGYHMAWFGYKMIDDDAYARFCAAGDVLTGISHE
jgi:hypothetical protein